MNYKTPITTITLLAVLLFSLSINVHAQSSPINLGISPPLSHVVIQPGKTATHAITIENQGNYDLEVIPSLRDFTSDNQTGNPVLLDEMTFPFIFLESNDIALNKPFTLPKQTSRQLVYRIDIPNTALQREYQFVNLFETTPLADSLGDQTKAQVKTQIASNFIVTITQDGRDEGIIELSSFEGPIIVDSFWPIYSQVSVKNVGKNTTVTLGNFTIINPFGQVVYSIELLPQNVLPGKTREVLGALPTQNNNEEYMTETPLRYKPFFLLGPYTIRLTYHSPNQEEQEFTHRVFALPISILIGLISIVAIYILYTKTGLFNLDRAKKSDETVDM